MADAFHEQRDSFVCRQLAAIGGGVAALFLLLVRVQVVQYAVFRTADRVVEGMDHRMGIFQYLPLAVSHAGQEQYVAPVQRFFAEQAACQPYSPFPAEYDVIHSLVRIAECLPFLETSQ